MFPGSSFVVVLGGMLVLGGYLLRRSARAVHRSSHRDVHAEARQQLQRTATAAETHVERLEVRLHEFERQVDARTSTRIAQLQTLITAGQQAAARLESLLNRTRDEEAAVAAELRPLIGELREAGYSASEIAGMLKQSAEQVQHELDRTAAPQGSEGPRNRGQQSGSEDRGAA